MHKHSVNHGDYIKAVLDRNLAENITRVLYPNDNVSGLVILFPAQHHPSTSPSHSSHFTGITGVWGRRGFTKYNIQTPLPTVRLRDATEREKQPKRHDLFDHDAYWTKLEILALLDHIALLS